MSVKLKELIDYLNENLEGKRYYPSKPYILVNKFLKSKGMDYIEVVKNLRNYRGVRWIEIYLKYKNKIIFTLGQEKIDTDEGQVFDRFELGDYYSNYDTFEDIIEDMNDEPKKRQVFDGFAEGENKMSFKIKELVDYLNQNLEGKKYYVNKPQVLASRYLKSRGIDYIEIEKNSYNRSGISMTSLEFIYKGTYILRIYQGKRDTDEGAVFRRFELPGSEQNKTFDDIIEEMDAGTKKRKAEEEDYLDNIQQELDSLGISYTDFKNIKELISGFYEEFYTFNDREGSRVLEDYLD